MYRQKYFNIFGSDITLMLAKMAVYEGLEVTGALLAFICSFLGAYWVYFKRHNYWAGKPIPSNSAIPILGNVVGILKGKLVHEIDQEFYDKYGRLVGTYFGMVPMIYVADPELVKLILVKDFSSFSYRRNFETNNPYVDNMLVWLKGDDKWRNVRNTITKAFTSGKLKKMMPLICDCAKLTVENFEKYFENGEPIDCSRIYGSYTLDVIANVAFGTKIDSQNDPNNEFVQHAKRASSTEINWKVIIPLLAPKFASKIGISVVYQETLDFFKDLTLEIVRRREANNEARHDFLQILIDSLKENNGYTKKCANTSNEKIKNGHVGSSVNSIDDIRRKPLTEDEFLAQTIMFFMAAYDTTSSTLTSITYFFSTNPDCQKNALEEVDRIWENRKTIDFECLSEAKYIGAAIDEALRLVPPFPKITRTCGQEYKLGNTGLTLPVGMIVDIPIFAMHHDPEFFPEPDKFTPERFLGEGKTAIANSYTYFPFGAGPRNCIAMRLALLEVKLCLLYVLKHFEFLPSEKTKIPIEFRRAGLLQPKDVILQLKRRT